jgi:hypothetical protein
MPKIMWIMIGCALYIPLWTRTWIRSQEGNVGWIFTWSLITIGLFMIFWRKILVVIDSAMEWAIVEISEPVDEHGNLLDAKK